VKEKKLSVFLMMMLDEDMCGYVDKNGGHDSGHREEKKNVFITLFLKS